MPNVTVARKLLHRGRASASLAVPGRPKRKPRLNVAFRRSVDASSGDAIPGMGVDLFFRLAIALVWSIAPVTLVAAPIDLNDFFADPTVTVAADGSAAALQEDPNLGAVLLSNDPGFGDPQVVFPAAGLLLLFNYDFIEGSGEADELGAFVIDAATGLSAGPSFEFFTQSSGSGTVAFDLTSLVGQTLGLQFQLSALPGDSGLSSIATVSQVRLEPVPEPSTTFLFASGFLLMLVRKKR